MNIFIVGGEKGSWQMRGKQIGEAIHARYSARPRPEDWAWADVIVLVKRAAIVWFREAKAANVPLIWDALDFWHQPSGNRRAEADLLREISEMVRTLKLSLVIGATDAMASAVHGVYLTHHSRIGLRPTPHRDELKVVAYEGSSRYLGSWRVALEEACARLGLTFVVNPPDLGQADLLVAFRGEEWDGWVCRQWKSGVKYVNAIAAGRPILTQATAAFGEIKPAGTIVEDPAQLVTAIETWMPIHLRKLVYKRSLRRAPAFAIDAVAARYLEIVRSVPGVPA